jgi:hypothetical protein
MIQITDDVIDRVMEDTYDAHKQGKLVEFLRSVDRRIENEQPLLTRYIDAGNRILVVEHPSEEGRTLSSGYLAACGIVFRMVDKQCKINGTEHPIVTKEDIDRANDRATLRQEMHGGGQMLEKRIRELINENISFGIYLFNYVSGQAPNELVARGFAMGAIGTYSAYEQAFVRTKVAR